MLKIRIRAPARAEIVDVFNWYPAHSPIDAQRFLDALDETFDLIEAYPQHNVLIRGQLRRKLVRGFPYGIYYKTCPAVNSVVGVIHGHRHPDAWLRRA